MSDTQLDIAKLEVKVELIRAELRSISEKLDDMRDVDKKVDAVEKKTETIERDMGLVKKGLVALFLVSSGAAANGIPDLVKALLG